jgi:hypothetical protein
MIVFFLAFIIIFGAIVVFADGVLNTPEYNEYVNLRDTDNCTQMNSSYCEERGLCIHAYQYCLMQQCPNSGIQW